MQYHEYKIRWSINPGILRILVKYMPIMIIPIIPFSFVVEQTIMKIDTIEFIERIADERVYTSASILLQSVIYIPMLIDPVVEIVVIIYKIENTGTIINTFFI